jgi:hypothetical protein
VGVDVATAVLVGVLVLSDGVCVVVGVPVLVEVAVGLLVAVAVSTAGVCVVTPTVLVVSGEGVGTTLAVETGVDVEVGTAVFVAELDEVGVNVGTAVADDVGLWVTAPTVPDGRGVTDVLEVRDACGDAVRSMVGSAVRVAIVVLVRAGVVVDDGVCEGTPGVFVATTSSQFRLGDLVLKFESTR